MSALEANIQKAGGYLQRFRGSKLGHFIGGKTHPGASSRTIENLSPVDSSVLNEVSCGDARDVDAAAMAACDAFPAWRSKSGDERRAILHRVADAIESRREEIALSSAWTRANHCAS